MTNKKFFLGPLIGFSLFLIYFSIYQISDVQYAIRINNINFLRQNATHFLIKKPGLHFKWPLLDQIVYIDRRIQHTQLQSLLSLEDNGMMYAEYFIDWRIKNPHRYVNFFVRKKAGWAVFLKKWSDQFLQSTLINIKIETPIANNFENLQVYLTEKAEAVGIEILTCHILHKIPTPETKANILHKICAKEAQRTQQAIHKAELYARSIYRQAKLKQAILYVEAKRKVRGIQNEAEISAMQICIDAYSKEPKFAAFYQNLQGETLVIGQSPKLTSLYQNLRGYNASFDMKMPNTTLFNAQTNAAL